MNRMIAITISAGATTRAAAGTACPPNRAFTIPAPAATRTRKKVPSSSANSRRPSYRSSQKLNCLTIEFGRPREPSPDPMPGRRSAIRPLARGSGPGSYARSGPGSYARSGPGSYGRSGPGSYGRSGPGSYGRSGPGSYGRSGPGSYGRSGPGSYGRSGPGSYGRSGPGSYGRSGPGSYGRSGPGSYGRSGPGPYGRSGPAPYGRSGSGPPGGSAWAGLLLNGSCLPRRRAIGRPG